MYWRILASLEVAVFRIASWQSLKLYQVGDQALWTRFSIPLADLKLNTAYTLKQTEQAHDTRPVDNVCIEITLDRDEALGDLLYWRGFHQNARREKVGCQNVELEDLGHGFFDYLDFCINLLARPNAVKFLVA